MFKKKCPRCEKKIDKKYDFCPYCGLDLKSKYDDEDYGLLGKNDLFDEENRNFMGFGEPFINKLINKAMKDLPTIMKSMEQQMNKEFNNPNQKPAFPTSNMRIRFMVNGKEIPINQMNEPEKIEVPKPTRVKLSEKQTTQLAKLPRKEPKTKMRRLSGKLIYEIEVPGVNDIQNVIVNQLENSIEIKAISKTKVYSKNLNVNLPILRYSLDKENIILELQGK